MEGANLNRKISINSPLFTLFFAPQSRELLSYFLFHQDAPLSDLRTTFKTGIEASNQTNSSLFSEREQRTFENPNKDLDGPERGERVWAKMLEIEMGSVE